MLKPRQRCLLAALVFAGLAGLLAAKVRGQTVDDVFITYRYAQNLVAGHGFVFNPGEWVLATTAPGWGLLLALGHLLCGLSLPVLGTWAFALCLVAIAVLCFSEGQRLGLEAESWLAGILLVSCSFLWPHNGFEYPASLLFLLLAARWAERHPVPAGLLAAAAVWCRPDTGLVLACLVVMLGWKHRRDPEGRRRILSFTLSAGGIVASGLILAVVFYGHPLPITLAAKRAQSQWLLPESSGRHFWISGYGWLKGTYAGPWTPVLGLVGGLGLLRMLRLDSQTWRLLAISSLTASVSYPLLGIPFYTWYAMPLLIGLLYGYALASGEIVRWLWRRGPGKPADDGPTAARSRHRLSRILAVGLAAFLLAFPGYAAWRTVRGFQLFDGFPRHQLYRQAGQWLAAQARPGDAFAFVEVGTLAFYSRLPARDLTGLVTPEVRPWSNEGDLRGAFWERPAPWLLNSPRLDSLMGPVLDSCRPLGLTEVHHFSNRDGSLHIAHMPNPAKAELSLHCPWKNLP